MLLSSVILVLREVLEAALLFSLLMALSKRLGISCRWVVVALITGSLLVGELLERYLFFAASVAPKMPGAPCT